MKAFRPRKRGRIWAEFTDVEARLLVNLTLQLGSLLNDRHATETADADPLREALSETGPVPPPEDPVLRRLLPDAYRDDAEDAAEYRRLTERGLVRAKAANGQLITDCLVRGGLDLDIEEGPPIEVELNPEEALAWMRAINDLRIALSIRLGIETEDDTSAVAHSNDDQVLVMFDVYEWLGYMQETIVESLR